MPLTYGYYEVLSMKSSHSTAFIGKKTIILPNGESYTRSVTGGNAKIVTTRSGPFLVESNLHEHRSLGKQLDSLNNIIFTKQSYYFSIIIILQISRQQFTIPQRINAFSYTTATELVARFRTLPQLTPCRTVNPDLNSYSLLYLSMST